MPEYQTAFETQTDIPQFDWNDIEETAGLEDGLARMEIVEAITTAIRGTERPRVLGIYGWWGTGKSYLLSLVIKRLLELNQQPNEKMRTIICAFNPWRYELEGDLAAGLIKVLANIDQSVRGNNRPLLGDTALLKQVAVNLLELILEIGPSLAPGGQVLTPFAKAGSGAIKVAKESSKAAKKPQAIAKVDEIRQKMEELVDCILKSSYDSDPTKEYRLVVFVDDLDRCSPVNMVRLFEWLKMHLLVRNCTYVIALDHVAAARAIVGQYKDYLEKDSGRAFGYRYLEKLVDSEYELQTAPQVERMALRQVYRDRSDLHDVTQVSQIARNLCGSDFPGLNDINQVLQLRCLLTARTMLKVVYRFKCTLKLILADRATQQRNRLPLAYPFWILFLIAMYYQLDPDCLDDFIRGRGPIYRLMQEPTSPGAVTTKEMGEGPMLEFCQFAEQFGRSRGRGLELPPNDMLAWLAAAIRQNALAE